MQCVNKYYYKKNFNACENIWMIFDLKQKKLIVEFKVYPMLILEKLIVEKVIETKTLNDDSAVRDKKCVEWSE